MHRRKVLSEETAADGRQKDKTDQNARHSTKFRDAETGDSSSSRLRQIFERTFVPLFLMFFTPHSVILLWYTVAHCDGSFARLFQILSDGGIVVGVARIWADIHIASLLAVMVIGGYIVWALVLMVSVPGPMVEGPVTPNGNVPRYRDNGLSCYVITMLAFTVVLITSSSSSSSPPSSSSL